MKQIVVVGLGNFGMRTIDELVNFTREIIVIDRDPVLVEKYKDKVAQAYISDAVDEETLRKIVPVSCDAAIIDLGSSIESSILVTNYLKKIGIKNVIVKATSDSHGEVLKLVGADRIVYPDLEAAKKIVPSLASSLIFNFIPISGEFVMAEVKIPDEIDGMTLIEANLRKRFSINVVAYRKEEKGDYLFFQPEYMLNRDDMLLVAGNEDDILRFSGKKRSTLIEREVSLFSRLFSKE